MTVTFGLYIIEQFIELLFYYIDLLIIPYYYATVIYSNVARRNLTR